MVDAGALDHSDDGVPAPSWPLTIALAAVIIVALVVGLIALADGAPTSRAGGDTAGPVVDRPDPSSTEAPSTEAPTTEAPTTATPTTAPVTEPPVTEPPATQPAPTQPPATTPPATSPPPAGPPGWVAVTSVGAGFSAVFPAAPDVASSTVAVPGGTATRTEHELAMPGGAVISMTSIPTTTGGLSVGEFLNAVSRQVARDVGGRLLPFAPTTVAGSPALPFRVRVAEGQLRVIVIYAGGRVHTLSMFTPGTGDTAIPDAVFDKIVASFRPI